MLGELGLHLSQKGIDSLRDHLDWPQDALLHEVHAAQKRFHDESWTVTFLYLKQGNLGYLNDDFGEDVRDAFRSATYDIEEASNCFALERYTATVLHCMRVLEHGLRALCARLSVPFGEQSWKRALEKIEARLKVLDSQVKQKSAWKKKRQFYAEATVEFTNIKDAWRNYAAHGHDTYDEVRAQKIMSATRNLMQHLATKIKETKP